MTSADHLRRVAMTDVIRPENADERRLNDNGGLLLGRNIAMLTLWWHQRSQKSERRGFPPPPFSIPSFPFPSLPSHLF